MAATTTAFKSLLRQLKSSYPEIGFTAGDEYRWSPEASTVYFNANSADAVLLLHETAHALLGHAGYSHDIELLRLEREAWTEASALAAKYEVAMSEDQIETALDTYRDWLHARSLCPHCRQNGVQASETNYLCLLCKKKWSVNDARHCGLKRHML